MIKVRELLDPHSGVSSKRYVGLVSLYALLTIAVVTLIPYTIPETNSRIIESICYTLGGTIIGVFIGTALEKKSKQTNNVE